MILLKINFLFLLQTIESDWVDDIVDSLMNTLWEVTMGEDGILMTLFNLIPFVGANPLSVEVFFLLAVFIGVLMFMRHYQKLIGLIE